MLIKQENKRIEAVYPAQQDSRKKCLSAVETDGLDFDGDGGSFRAQTALYAAALAMSAADKTMLQENLTELGYDKIVFLAYDGDNVDKTGLALALKEDKGGTTAAVVTRPTVGKEWYSNFDVGYGTEHLGFLKAAEYAEQRLTDYLFVRQPKHTIRFLVTGYSRGGAVANILAKRLCDRYGLDAVRGYTFGAPNTCVSVKGARYGSIFNLVRDEDFFTRIPLAGWGYTKYGRTISLSDCADIGKRYRILTGEEYIGFSSGKEAEGFLCAAMRLAPNIHAYYERKYPVGGHELALYDYMLTVAQLLADEADESTGDIMMGAMVSDFADLSDFLMSGMDIGAMLSPAQGIPRCSVADSHSPAAYMAALDMYLG